ncbi:MAG: YkgJ family cysteine cluster protein [Candidatus Binatia bacterium]
MNRAERRRQAKTASEKTTPRTSSSSLPFPVAAIKAQLQQATSPVEVRQFLAALVAQGLPLKASEELSAYAAQYHETRAALQGGSKATTVSSMVANAHTWADSLINRSPELDRRACRAGCAFCCYLPTVLVTAAEAVHLAAWLRTHCTAEELTTIRQRLTERLNFQNSSPTQGQQPLPCALLHGDRCMAYAARPLKCRGWTSLRREACERAYGHGSAASQVPADAYAFIMGNAVLNGLSDSVSHSGLDGGSYDLTHALWCVLDIPDAVERWRNGERLFKVIR